MEIVKQEISTYRTLTQEREVLLSVPGAELAGFLSIPHRATGAVLFANSTGSARFEPRNQRTARAFNQFGLATLLIDLLTPTEEAAHHEAHDIELLGRRVSAAVRWLHEAEATRELKVGIFGTGTGAAAALWSAAGLEEGIAAIAARGARPDLAGDLLKEVSAPTLLLVGELDTQVLERNRLALPQLRNAKLDIVEGASHRFEEPNATEWVENAAAAWFLRYLKTEARRASA